MKTIITILLLTLSVSAHAAKPSRLERIIEKVDAIHVPQMLAIQAVANGTCFEGLAFKTVFEVLHVTKAHHTQINGILSTAGATHWTVVKYAKTPGIGGTFIHAVPMICSAEIATPAKAVTS